MGWKYVLHEVDKRDKTEPETTLWTDGGFNGVEVRYENTVIHIPRSLLLELMVCDYTRHQVTRLESMDIEGILSRIYSH